MIQADVTKEEPWHSWNILENALEIEAWLQLNNDELQQKIIGEKSSPYAFPMNQGQGICFQLTHGGEIYCHTNGDGDIILDLSEEALWCSPVITACTQITAPRGRIWILPGDVLIQLILGLNSLISRSRLVLKHRF
jgi:hypothetical protein